MAVEKMLEIEITITPTYNCIYKPCMFQVAYCKQQETMIVIDIETSVDTIHVGSFLWGSSLRCLHEDLTPVGHDC